MSRKGTCFNIRCNLTSIYYLVKLMEMEIELVMAICMKNYYDNYEMEADGLCRYLILNTLCIEQ